MVDYKLMLLMGEDVVISDNITYKSPMLKTISQMDYNDIIFGLYLFYDPKDAIIQQKDFYEYIQYELKLDYYSTFNYIFKQADNVREFVLKALKIHINGDVDISHGRICINDKVLNKEEYDLLCRVVQINYNFYDKRLDDYGYSGYMRKLQEQSIRDKKENRVKLNQILNKKEENNYDQLYNTISIVQSKNGMDFVKKSNMYQLFDTYSRIVKEKNYDLVSIGVANGTIKFEELDKNDWTKS